MYDQPNGWLSEFFLENLGTMNIMGHGTITGSDFKKVGPTMHLIWALHHSTMQRRCVLYATEPVKYNVCICKGARKI